MKRQERIKPVIEIEIIHLAYKKYKCFLQEKSAEYCSI
jgi:hypothetical protein